MGNGYILYAVTPLFAKKQKSVSAGKRINSTNQVKKPEAVSRAGNAVMIYEEAGERESTGSEGPHTKLSHMKQEAETLADDTTIQI